MEVKIFCRCKSVSFLVGLRTYQHPCTYLLHGAESFLRT